MNQTTSDEDVLALAHGAKIVLHAGVIGIEARNSFVMHSALDGCDEGF